MDQHKISPKEKNSRIQDATIIKGTKSQYGYPEDKHDKLRAYKTKENFGKNGVIRDADKIEK